MSQINTNVSSLIAQRILGQQNRSLNKSLERLSTGLAINRGADSPSGLIASENLRSEKNQLSAALNNAQRAEQVINIAEGGLQEVGSLLQEVQSLVGETANDAGLSVEEKEANQLQIDSILQTIDRIAGSTSFQGTKLLNGSFDFTVSAQAATVADFQLNGAKLTNGNNVEVQVAVTASAQHAGLFLSAGGAALDLSAADASLTFELAGAKGSRQFSFASGTSLTSVAASINTFTSVTGVSAAVSGTGLVVKSDEFGSDQFVSISVSDGGGQGGDGIIGLAATDENSTAGAATAFGAASSEIRDKGQDVAAIVNGVTATSRGKTAQINTDFLDVSIELTAAGAQAAGTVDAFTITGGGAKFNIGASVDVGSEVRIGLENVVSRNVGSTATGFLSELGSGKSANLVDGDIGKAQKIADKAVSQIAQLRGRLGAFQKNVVGSTVRSLNVALENTSAAESAIRDTDFAEESASLTRSQILVSAATSVLAIANSQPQSVLALI